MPLDKLGLKLLLEEALNTASKAVQNPPGTRAQLATDISNAIDAFVKSGDVKPGITVSTTGTAAFQTGATTGIGKII